MDRSNWQLMNSWSTMGMVDTRTSKQRSMAELINSLVKPEAMYSYSNLQTRNSILLPQSMCLSPCSSRCSHEYWEYIRKQPITSAMVTQAGISQLYKLYPHVMSAVFRVCLTNSWWPTASTPYYTRHFRDKSKWTSSGTNHGMQSRIINRLPARATLMCRAGNSMKTFSFSNGMTV